MIKKYLFYFSFLILLILPVLALLYPGLPITHDGQDHVARIANFYQNLLDGNLIPRWAANLNWGYGHPILEFLYPLPSYIASFFHLVGFSLVNSIKIVFGLGLILSFVSMYLWLSQFSSKYSALFGAVLYTYAPYRFVEVYVRGDIGENLAFAFVPLTLYFIYKLYKNNKTSDLILAGISLGLLILSHNAISLMFMPFIVFYGLFLIYKSKDQKKKFINLITFLAIGFAVSAFFWIPALMEAKYTLRNIVTKGAYISSFVSIPRLIYSPWSYGISGQFTVQLGLFQWISTISSTFLIYKYKLNKNKDYLLLLILLIFTLFSIFLMLPQSNFIWSKILLLQNFQFPWRFLAIIVFTSTVFGSFLAENLPKKFNLTVITFSIILIIFISSFYWNAKGYLQKNENFYSGIFNSTTDTGESAPIWSVRFMEHSPKAPLEVLDGDAKVNNLQRNSTNHKYKVSVNKRTLFEENTLYFPGWSIKANGKDVVVQFQNMQYRGVMLFFLDKGNYIVDAKYKETKLRLISDWISLISIAISVVLFVYLFVKRKVN